MNHRIVIRLQNSRPNIRPADHTQLITKTSKDRNNDMTVLELALKYIATKTNSRPTTRMGYQTVLNTLKSDSLDLFQLAMVVEFGYRFAKCTRKMLLNYITSWVMLKLKLYLEFMVSIVSQIIGNLTLMHLRRIELILEKKLYMIS